MFKAKTIMNKGAISVRQDTEVYEAIHMMVEHNITGLPVVNNDMTLAGIVTEKDVLRLLCNPEGCGDRVEDFMTDAVVSFDQDDSLIDIAETFIENHFRRVPITSHGKLVGIISRKDIIAYILKLRHKDVGVATHAQV